MANVGPPPPVPPAVPPPQGVPPGDRLNVWREMISSINIPVEVMRQMSERQIKREKTTSKDAERAKRLFEANKKRRGRSLQKRTRIIE